MQPLSYIQGLHHVTATVNDAREDYTFYTRVLGQRFVKETVNFDNEQVYHFYYGNRYGSPSTIFTTFPYKDQGVRQGRPGSGQVYETAWTIPEGALAFWRERLEGFGLDPVQQERFGRGILTFNDPSGLHVALIEDALDQREPLWVAHGLTPTQASRGVHHVTLAIDDSDVPLTLRFLEEFGYHRVQTDGPYTLLEAGKGGAGNSLVVQNAGNMPRGVNGLGTVHHVAHRVENIEESLQMKSWLESQYGLRVTQVMDRKYFRSIYFMIPGGVLFEIATATPGFLVDESDEDLGSALRLPDWQEPRRDAIVASLQPYR